MNHREFALALGGGSARGMAHVGLLRFLLEKNFQPSLVAGTSMGAIIAAMYALGNNLDAINELVESDILDVVDLNPINGMFSSDKIKKLLEPFFGEKTFSETKIPLAIVATCLTNGEKQIFREGKILDAVCASIALPGVFSPYKIDDKYYIDGAMRENLPLSACGNLPIIASSVTMPTGNPNVRKISHFIRPFTTLYDAFTIMLDQQERLLVRSHNDICFVETRDPSVHYLDFKNSRKLIISGYSAASSAGIEKFLQKNQKTFL